MKDRAGSSIITIKAGPQPDLGLAVVGNAGVALESVNSSIFSAHIILSFQTYNFI